MMMSILLINLMFVSGLFVFCFQRKHFLVVLLSLEYLVVILYFFLSFYLSLLSNEFFFLMIFLTMSVCEGALGLSILVSLIRFFGNDYMVSFFMLW